MAILLSFFFKFSLMDSVVISMHRLLNVLEAIAPFKQFNKLRKFLQQQLPPGFPVKIGTAL